METKQHSSLPVFGQRVPAGLLLVSLILLSLSSVGLTCIAVATPTPPPLTATPPPATEPPQALSPESPTATPEPQTLRFGLPAGPQRLDPAVATDAASALVSAQLYETLVRFVPGTTEIEPALATTWSVSEDRLTWEFALREDVTFHNGTPLNAEAVAWNFRRWMDPDHPAHKGDFRFWEGMFGGYNDQPLPDEPAQNLVAAVETPDPQTVRLLLNRPFTPLLHNLAMTPFAIQSPEALMSQGAEVYGVKGGARPAGTGPFRLASWSEGEVVLEAHAGYWAGSPRLSRLVFRVIPDDGERFAALQAGEIAGMTSPSQEDLTRADQDPELKVVMDPRPTTAFLNFNLDGEILGKREVRRAIAYAINKPALIEEAFGPTWQPASQMLPPALWGYNEAVTSYPYDPQRARELLAGAGLPAQFEVDLWYPDRPRPYLPDPRAAAESIARDLEAVGIRVTLDTEHWSAYLADRARGAFSMWLLGWTGYNGDPDSFFFYHFGLPTPREGNYVNMDVRDLLLRGQVVVDPETREDIYQEVAQIVHQDVPRLFLAHPREPILLSQAVEGFTPNPAGPETFFGVSLRATSAK